MRILFVGDVVGKPGRRAVRNLLPDLRSQFGASLVITNGENAAGGLGITRSTANELLGSGIDVITLGNHAFAKREAFELVQEERRVLRPANYPPDVPGSGLGVFTTADGLRVAVGNLIGRTFMAAVDCPFRAADALVEEAAECAAVLIIDAHAEATSEKVALGWYLDGRASAVIGTHTHVQTSDERVLPQHTAYITDAGMTGARDSVLGLDRAVVIERFKTTVTKKFALAEGEAWLSGVVLDLDESTGRARSISRISRPEN